MSVRSATSLVVTLMTTDIRQMMIATIAILMSILAPPRYAMAWMITATGRLMRAAIPTTGMQMVTAGAIRMTLSSRTPACRLAMCPIQAIVMIRMPTFIRVRRNSVTGKIMTATHRLMRTVTYSTGMKMVTDGATRPVPQPRCLSRGMLITAVTATTTIRLSIQEKRKLVMP